MAYLGGVPLAGPKPTNTDVSALRTTWAVPVFPAIGHAVGLALHDFTAVPAPFWVTPIRPCVIFRYCSGVKGTFPSTSGSKRCTSTTLFSAAGSTPGSFGRVTAVATSGR